MSHQSHLNSIVNLESAIGASPVLCRNSVYCAVFGAGGGVGTVVPIPVDASEAVGVSGCSVDPPPVGVQCYTASFGGAS